MASGTYCVSAVYDCTTNNPLDVVVEVSATTSNTPAGNKQVVVFVQESMDNTTFRSGPTSGTSTTDEPNLRPLGAVPIASSGVPEVGSFSVAQALGYRPNYFRIVTKNDLGVALTSGSLSTQEITGTST